MSFTVPDEARKINKQYLMFDVNCKFQKAEKVKVKLSKW